MIYFEIKELNLEVFAAANGEIFASNKTDFIRNFDALGTATSNLSAFLERNEIEPIFPEELPEVTKPKRQERALVRRIAASSFYAGKEIFFDVLLLNGRGKEVHYLIETDNGGDASVFCYTVSGWPTIDDVKQMCSDVCVDYITTWTGRLPAQPPKIDIGQKFTFYLDGEQR